MNTTNKINYAQILFNDNSLRKVIFSFLKKPDNIIYSPEQIILDKDFEKENLKTQFENHKIKYNFLLSETNIKIFYKQSKKAFKIIKKSVKLKKFKLNKYQKSKIKDISLMNIILYASIVKHCDYPFLKVWFYTMNRELKTIELGV